jgi:hypothetical protein
MRLRDAETCGAFKADPKHVRDLYTQFNALDRAAGILIEKDHSAAC